MSPYLRQVEIDHSKGKNMGQYEWFPAQFCFYFRILRQSEFNSNSFGPYYIKPLALELTLSLTLTLKLSPTLTLNPPLTLILKNA